jgi:hypothetical protein
LPAPYDANAGPSDVEDLVEKLLAHGLVELHEK